MRLSFSLPSASQVILAIFFILLGTSFNFATIEGKNLVFIGFSIVGIAVLLLVNSGFPLTVSRIVLLIFAVLCVSFLINFRRAEDMSFLYSVFFIVTFYIYTSFFKARIDASQFVTIIQVLLLYYLVVLVAGQIYVALGLFSGSGIKSGLIHGALGTLYEADRGFRYYSLSTEPSYAAFIVISLLYAYLSVSPNGRVFNKHSLFVWGISLYQLVSFQSGYGVILFFMLLFFRVSLRNAIILVIIAVSVVTLALVTKQPAAERVIMILSQVGPSNIEHIRSIDYSASFRILPMYYYLRDISLLDYHFYLGYGAGTSSAYLVPILFKTAEIDTYEGGFLPQFLYDYGILLGVCFALFLKREVLRRVISFELLVVLLMLTNANFNTQLFWFVLLVLTLRKYYLESQTETARAGTNDTGRLPLSTGIA